MLELIGTVATVWMTWVLMPIVVIVALALVYCACSFIRAIWLHCKAGD